MVFKRKIYRQRLDFHEAAPVNPLGFRATVTDARRIFSRLEYKCWIMYCHFKRNDRVPEEIRDSAFS